MPPPAAPAGGDAPGDSVDLPADATRGDAGGDRTSADPGAGFTVGDPSALRDAAVGEGRTGESASGPPDEDDLTAPDVGGADTPDEEGDDTQPDEGAGVLENVTMMDSLDEHVTGPTMLDPIEEPKNFTYVDWIGGTRADAGSIPIVAPAPVTPGPPRTRVIEEQEPPPPGERSGTRVMSGTMVGDLLHGAPMPERPVDQIAPPPAPVSMPKVTERFGVRFLSERDDATELFDELHRTASRSGRPPALLVVGAPHAGQRRLTRLIARTFAGAGVGDGSVRTADGADLHGDHVTAVTAILRGSGPPLLFERLDRAVLDASDPDRVVAAVMGARENKAALIATCEPDSYARLRERFPELTAAFQVFRLPDLAGVQARLALLHVLADERRVTITASGLDVVRGDLTRLGGHGDLVGARLVEAYLERAVARHVERAGAPRDRMVLVPVDFTGVAEEIEPALRPPRDVDGYLRGLEEMIGLDEVKRTVGGLVTEARMAADRAARGLPSGNPSRHLIFLGRPGTGKATVAGLIGGIYAALNLLDTGQLVVCGAKDLTGSETAAYVDRAAGGVLLIEDAALLDRMPAAVDELARLMAERRDKFMVICAGLPDEMEGFLLAHPGFRTEFGAIIEFREPTERQLVQLFSRLAERDLYMLDEELRVELLDRFAGMRRYPGFAFADTVRRLFDQIVARQAARLSGAQVNPAAVARLSVRDLPDSEAGALLEELHPLRRRSPE
jgi:adenylate kinase family enzyme